MENIASIRPAKIEDAPILGVIAPAAYAASYAYLWDDGAAFVEQLKSFSADVFTDQIADPQYGVWLAELDGQPAGFLTLKYGSCEPVGTTPGGAEIPRIYFLPHGTGRGLAKLLLHEAEEAARLRGNVSYLWLDAMASADWAQRTYKKWGFIEIGRDRFPKNVKETERDMIVMIKPLD